MPEDSLTASVLSQFPALDTLRDYVDVASIEAMPGFANKLCDSVTGLT